jgi:hypothetical protein
MDSTHTPGTFDHRLLGDQHIEPAILLVSGMWFDQ